MQLPGKGERSQACHKTQALSASCIPQSRLIKPNMSSSASAMLPRLICTVWLLLAFLAVRQTVADYCNSWSMNDCDNGKVCCNNQCVYGSCLGHSCTLDSDCNSNYANSYTCCNGICAYDCYDPTPAIVGSLVGVGVVIVIVSAVIYFCCCRRPVQPTGGQVVTAPTQRIIATTTTTNYNCPQPAPYQVPYQQPPPAAYGQPPPAACGQPPPAAYGGYGAVDPRPGGHGPPPQYQPPMAAEASYAPPPYVEREVPQKNYNAALKTEPSAPPF